MFYTVYHSHMEFRNLLQLILRLRILISEKKYVSYKRISYKKNVCLSKMRNIDLCLKLIIHEKQYEIISPQFYNRIAIQMKCYIELFIYFPEGLFRNNCSMKMKMQMVWFLTV